MNLECPECSATLEGSPGQEMVCPACMTPFVVPAQARAVRAFDVQMPDGVVLFGLGRHAVREAIYAGRIGSGARVRHDAGKWELIGGYPEFAAVFRLLGEDLAPLAGTRKLAGWKGASESEPSEPPRFTTDLPHFLTEPRAVRGRPADAPNPSMAPPERFAPAPAAPRSVAPASVAPARATAPPPERAAASGDGIPTWAWGVGLALAFGIGLGWWLLR